MIEYCGSHYVAFQPEMSTDINVPLLTAWRSAASDPDWAVVNWLRYGAPAGIARTAEDCGGFPLINDEPDMSPRQLQTGEEHFSNTSGVDENPIAVNEISEHIALGHLKVFARPGLRNNPNLV